MKGRMQPSGRSTFEVVTFDLFGTLAQLDESRLPQISVDGATLPSLLAALLAQPHELILSADLGEVIVAYFQAGAELRRPGPDRDREVKDWNSVFVSYPIFSNCSSIRTTAVKMRRLTRNAIPTPAAFEGANSTLRLTTS